MHLFEVSIMICQPSNVMFTSVRLLFDEYHFLGSTNPDINLKRIYQLYNFLPKIGLYAINKIDQQWKSFFFVSLPGKKLDPISCSQKS